MSVKVFGNLTNKTFNDERKYNIFIDETNFLPRGLKKYFFKKYLSEELFNNFGENAFIIPERKLFPIINPSTRKIDQRMVEFSLIRLLQLYRIDSSFKQYYQKCKDIFIKNNFKELTKITLVETNQEVSLVFFLEEQIKKIKR